MITENYIKMCEAAEEIQKEWKPVNWDRFIFKNDKTVGVGCGHIKSYMKVWYIWLPTQEQLQEMMISTLDDDFIGCVPLFLNEKLEECLFSNGIYNWGTSYVELWLAFVMYEKYNKIWTGEKWEEVKTSE